MPMTCCILSCKLSRLYHIRLFRIPGILQKKKGAELQLQRQKAWIQAIGLEAFKGKKLPHLRVCEFHFISGEPAKLNDTTHPDWVPSLNLDTNQRKRKSPLVTRDQFTSKCHEKQELRQFNLLRHFHCIAPTCSVTSNDTTNAQFFRMPDSNRLLKLWANNLNLPTLPKTNLLVQKNYRICDRHFTTDCFRAPDRKKLLPGAIPTIFDNIEEPKREPSALKIKFKQNENNQKQLKLNESKETTNMDTRVKRFREIKPKPITEPNVILTVQENVELQNLINKNTLPTHAISDIPKDPLTIDYQKLVNECITIRPVEKSIPVVKTTPLIQTPPLLKTQFIRSYCRLCSEKFFNSNLIPLFNPTSKENDYEELLNICVPGMISKDDKLSHQVCQLCLTKLKDCSAMIEGFKQADNALKKMFPGPNPKVKSSKSTSNIAVKNTRVPVNNNTPEPPAIENVITDAPQPETTENVSSDIQMDLNDTNIKYGCQNCDEIFDSLELFVTHSMGKHQTKIGDTITFNKVPINMNNETPLNLAVINCSICAETFESLETYNTHMFTHNVFKCLQCGACFGRKIGLISHRRIHTRSKFKFAPRKILSNDQKNRRIFFIKSM